MDIIAGGNNFVSYQKRHKVLPDYIYSICFVQLTIHMVRICNDPYPTNSKWEPYFELFPFPLSDFQKYAIEGIVEGHHVLVTAHTGSGKTLPAEFAIEHFVKQGKKIILFDQLQIFYLRGL